MSNKDIGQENKPVNKGQVGRVQNEPVKRTDHGVVPLEQEEVGMMKNEKPGTGLPSKPEIGMENNETPGTGLPSKPEIGRMKNESPDKK